MSEPIAVNANTLAQQCRDHAEECAIDAERLLAGAQLMVGVDDRVVGRKTREAAYAAGQANAYGSVATSLEALIAKYEEVPANA